MTQTDVRQLAKEIIDIVVESKPETGARVQSFLLNYREQCRNEAIEEVAMHFQTILTQPSGEFNPDPGTVERTFIMAMHEIRSLKQKTNGTDR